MNLVFRCYLKLKLWFRYGLLYWQLWFVEYSDFFVLLKRLDK